MVEENILNTQLDNFFKKYKRINLKKGKIFLRPGEIIDFIAYLINGNMRIYTINENGQEITLPFYRSVMNFTIIMTLMGVKNNFYFEALTPVEIVKVPIAEAQAFFRTDSSISQMIMKNVSLSFIGILEKMAFLLAGDSYNKVAATIQTLIEIEKVEFPITHRLIASLTGLTRETVTLQILKLEKQGIIKKNKRKIVIVNKEKLLAAIKEHSN